MVEAVGGLFRQVNSAESREQPAPLELRGHHLKRVKMLLVLYGINGSVETAVEGTAEFARIAMKGSKTEGYKEDIAGVTAEEEELYWDNYKSLLTSILNSPDGRIVKIIADRKDDFCKLCVKGEHCSIKGPWGMSADYETVWNLFGAQYASKLGSYGEINMKLGELKEKITAS